MLNDLTFSNSARTESTFYDDLQEIMYKIIPEDKIRKNYIYEGIDNAKYYPVDYCIEGKHSPLYVFGIPESDKDRLTTIVFERRERISIFDGNYI